MQPIRAVGLLPEGAGSGGSEGGDGGGPLTVQIADTLLQGPQPAGHPGGFLISQALPVERPLAAGG